MYLTITNLPNQALSAMGYSIKKWLEFELPFDGKLNHYDNSQMLSPRGCCSFSPTAEQIHFCSRVTKLVLGLMAKFMVRMLYFEFIGLLVNEIKVFSCNVLS